MTGLSILLGNLERGRIGSTDGFDESVVNDERRRR